MITKISPLNTRTVSGGRCPSVGDDGYVDAGSTCSYSGAYGKLLSMTNDDAWDDLEVSCQGQGRMTIGPRQSASCMQNQMMQISNPNRSSKRFEIKLIS